MAADYHFQMKFVSNTLLRAFLRRIHATKDGPLCRSTVEGISAPDNHCCD